VCLILFCVEAHPTYRLILGANRDEFYERPTAPLAWWDDAAASPAAPFSILGGRDRRGGGTWMGITRAGRFAALTNFRDPASNLSDAPSRGALVKNFLAGRASPQAYLADIARSGAAYNGFNLLIGDGKALYYYSNRHPGAGKAIQLVLPGVHGLSNRFLDTPWPKVARGKKAMARLCGGGRIDPEAMLDLLADRVRAPDDLLPDTGVGMEWERILSPIFIGSPTYGTRSSSVLLIGADGKVEFVERTFVPDGRSVRIDATRRFRFQI